MLFLKIKLNMLASKQCKKKFMNEYKYFKKIL